MALSERYEEGQIEIVGEYRKLQVRTDRVIYDDTTGEEITRTHHREVLAPDDDVSNRGELVRAVAGAVWTQAIKDKWKNRPRQDPEGPPAR